MWPTFKSPGLKRMAEVVKTENMHLAVTVGKCKRCVAHLDNIVGGKIAIVAGLIAAVSLCNLGNVR